MADEKVINMDPNMMAQGPSKEEIELQKKYG